MFVLHRGTSDDRVIKVSRRPFLVRLNRFLLRCLRKFSQQNWSTTNPVLHTFGKISAGLVKELNASDADILHLHWISNMLSISDVSRLQKPIVWTLHDMWAFCGGEHYAPEGFNSRFKIGYNIDNRPAGESGPDLNRKAWATKRMAWNKKQFTIVCPSRWLAECASQSILLANSTVHIVSNPLDTKRIWRPANRETSRVDLGLPSDKKIVLFGADGGLCDPRKGSDLLSEAISKVVAKLPGEVELLIYGESRKLERNSWPCPIHYLGVVHDDRLLSKAYSAADVMLVPSRQDNLPNTALEAQACGTPVVAFNVGGLPEIIAHRETGWLAKPFDTEDFAEGILWILAEHDRRQMLSLFSRKRAYMHYSEPVVARGYASIYENLLASVSR